MTNRSSRFCSGCGTAQVVSAAICASCGTPAQSQPLNYVSGKSKTTAVLLAVFLGFWSWLYTFKVDKSKFFIGLVLYVVTTIFIISWLGKWAMAQSAYLQCVSDNWYSDYGDASTCDPTAGLFTPTNLMAVAIGFGNWLWTVIDQSRRPSEFFENFPK